MRKIIFFLAAIFIISCSAAKRKATEHIEPLKTKIHSKIAPEFYLDNRIPNCDSAIFYMRSIITPGDLTINKLPELRVESNVKGESKEFFRRRDNYQFYVSLRCLKGKDAQVVYDLFVKSKYHELLRQTEKIADKDGGYYLDVCGLGGFGFKIKKGHVKFCSADIYTESH